MLVAHCLCEYRPRENTSQLKSEECPDLKLRSYGEKPICLRFSVEFVNPDLSAESIAVQTEKFRRFTLVAFGLRQRRLDKSLLEHADCFVQKNPLL